MHSTRLFTNIAARSLARTLLGVFLKFVEELARSSSLEDQPLKVTFMLLVVVIVVLNSLYLNLCE